MMIRRQRRAFTLVELLVAVVLFGILGTAILKVLTSQQRAYAGQLQRTALQQNIRVAATVLPNELRGLDPADSDIVAMTDSSLTIRSIQQLGILCSAPVLGGAVNNLSLTMRGPLYSAARAFTTTDSVLVFYEGNSKIRTDDSWIRGKVLTTGSGSCPTLPNTGNDPTLTVLLMLRPSQLNAVGAIPTGAPIYGYEIRTYQVFKDATDKRWYLGLQRGNTTDAYIGPLVGQSVATSGPLEGELIGAKGVTFTYRDAAGAVTAIPTSVAQIGVTLRAETRNPIRKSNGVLGFAQDSVSFVVSVRNNPRF